MDFFLIGVGFFEDRFSVQFLNAIRNQLSIPMTAIPW
jgi:hypothetical protein